MDDVHFNIKQTRKDRITTLLELANHTIITVEEAAVILGMPKRETAKLMSRWAGQGRLSRLKRGLYVSGKPDLANLDPWLFATRIYHSCYIGALSAAEFWGLTDKKSPEINVFSPRRPKNLKTVSGGIHLSVRTVPADAMFGLQSILRQHADILVSDPARTIIDFMIDPHLGGGIQNVIGIFNRYLKSGHRNVDQLFCYAKKTLNGAVLKRLGYLLEICGSGEFNVMAFCKMLETSGNIKLDPGMSADRLITRWGLWVPAGWESNRYPSCGA